MTKAETYELDMLRADFARLAVRLTVQVEKTTALRLAAECLVEEIEHVVGTAVVADMIIAIEASR